MDSFRTKCLRELQKIQRAWPNLHYRTVKGGLVVLMLAASVRCWQARAPTTTPPAVLDGPTAPRVATTSPSLRTPRARLPHSVNVPKRTFTPFGLLRLQNPQQRPANGASSNEQPSEPARIVDVERQKYLTPNSNAPGAPAVRQMGTVLGRQPDPAAARHVLGDDEGCFAAALDAVRRHGGVLEPPEASPAWTGLRTPHATESRRVVVTAWQGEWTCCVEKGHSGHRSRKTTWWYAVGGELPGSGGGRAQRPVRSRMDTTPQPSGGARSRWRPASASLTVNATPHRSHPAIS